MYIHIFDIFELESESTFPFQYLINFKLVNLWSPLAPLPGEIDLVRLRIFCRKFNFQQVLFEVFFDVIGIFGSIES